MFHYVLVQLGQHIPHTQGGILSGAEHDGAGHPVGALKVSGDLLGHFADAVLYDDVVVVVAVGIDAVRDLIAVDVQLSLSRPPALSNVGHNIDDLERRKKTVLDAFFQAVGIDRLAKIAEVGDVFGFPWGWRSCRSAQHPRNIPAPAASGFPPWPILGDTRHDDQVEEIRRKQLTEVFLVIVSHQLLVQGKNTPHRM